MSGEESDTTELGDEGDGGDGDGDGDGCEPWVAVFPDEGSSGFNGVTTREGTQVYFAGYSVFGGEGSFNSRDPVVGAYSASGVQLWVQLIDSEIFEDARDITIDPSGNLVVTGYRDQVVPPGSGQIPYDGFISKFDPNGTAIWSHVLGTDGSEIANDVAVDAEGSVFVTGGTGGVFEGQVDHGGADAFVVKYNTDGMMMWTRQIGTNAYDDTYGIAVDGDGNVVIAGATEGEVDGGSSSGLWDVLVMKVNASGEVAWARQFGTSDYDSARGVATDAAGNVFVAGWAGGSLAGGPYYGNGDAFLTMLDASGTLQWTQMLGTDAFDSANDVTTDAAGNIYIGGYTEGTLEGHSSFGGRDVMIAKFDAEGELQQTWQIGTEFDDSGYDITVGSNGHIFVGGDRAIDISDRAGFLTRACQQ